MSAPRVLIVDDNFMTVELVTIVLEEDAIVVASAGNAIQALEQIPLFEPDLILMDIQLPGMDGLELTGLLKQDPTKQHIKIVAFTASAMKSDEARMLAAGCDGYVSKPFDIRTLAARVRAFIASTP